MGWSGQVVCDGCGREFRIEPKVKPLKGGGEEHFFKCPNKRCGRRYVTARGVALRAEIERARGELGQAQGERRVEQAELIQGLVKQLGPEVSGGVAG